MVVRSTGLKTPSRLRRPSLAALRPALVCEDEGNALTVMVDTDRDVPHVRDVVKHLDDVDKVSSLATRLLNVLQELHPGIVNEHAIDAKQGISYFGTPRVPDATGRVIKLSSSCVKPSPLEEITGRRCTALTTSGERRPNVSRTFSSFTTCGRICVRMISLRHLLSRSMAPWASRRKKESEFGRTS